MEWTDAFDDTEVHPDDLTDEYTWTSYGRVLRHTDDFITIASNDGGKGKDRQVSATTVLNCMVLSITELGPVE